MKKLNILFAVLALAAILCPSPARAQFLGFTSPQSVLSNVATGVACTGAAQNFSTANTALNALNFRNLGQTQHQVTFVLTGAPSNSTLVLQGVDSHGIAINISPLVQPGGTLSTVSGSGAFAEINIQVTCNAGNNFNLTYAGSSATVPVIGGTQFINDIDQFIFNGQTGGANQNGVIFTTPFGNSSGVLRFQYNSANVAGSSLTVLCINGNGGAAVTLKQFVFPLANALGTQLFKVPPATCPESQVNYTSGGAGGPIQTEYILDAPGDPVNVTLGTYTHITTNAAISVKGTSGTLVSISVNTPAIGTITIFDLNAAGCAAPASNQVAIITATATAPLGTIPYNIAMLNGICVQASVNMDLTVSTQ